MSEDRARLVSTLRRGCWEADTWSLFGRQNVVVVRCTAGDDLTEFVFAVGCNSFSVRRRGEERESFFADDWVTEEIAAIRR